MPSVKLISAVNSIKWSDNVTAFTADVDAVESIAKCCLRLATWSKQFETIEKDNPALSFTREMQVCGHLVATATSIAVYKLAASAMRSMLETALYYTYFRSHPTELTTLIKNPKFFISKSDVLDYHAMHTEDFQKLQTKIGLVSQLNPWYSSISAIVHGQIPGKWSQHGFSNMKYDKVLQEMVVREFCQGEEIVHRLFLCTVGRELWSYISPTAKKTLLHGLSGELKKEFGFDSA